MAAVGPPDLPDDPTAMALDLEELRLLERQIVDLTKSIELELDPDVRPALRLMLAEIHIVRARKHRFVHVERTRMLDDGVAVPDALFDHLAVALADEERATRVLEQVRGDARATDELQRTALWTLADLYVQAGEPMRAVPLLERLAVIAGEPCLEARARGRIGRLLVRQDDFGRLEEAQARFDRANALCASVEFVLGSAQSAERLGHSEQALRGYGRVMAFEPASPGVGSAQRYAVAAIGRLLAVDRGFDEASVYLEGLGPAANRVWYRLGRSLQVRHRPGEAIRAYHRALRLSPSDEHRARARAHIVDAACALGQPSAITDAVARLDADWAVLDELPEVLKPNMHLTWSRAAQGAVEHIAINADRWPDAAADRVFAVYLGRFPQAEFVPRARFIRGVRVAQRASPATRCSAHRTTADDFIAAFDGLMGEAPDVAARAAVLAMRSLDACRPDEADDALRPRVSPTDQHMLKFAARALARVPEGGVPAAEILTLVGRVNAAHDNAGIALEAYTAAAAVSGDHREDALRGWAMALIERERWSELEALASSTAADSAVSDTLRTKMQALASKASYSAALEAPEAERAERLTAHAERYPDAASAPEALVEAARLFATGGAGGQAQALLSRAVGQYPDVDGGRRARLALARFLEARGRTREAAERYHAYLLDPPTEGIDPAEIDDLRRKLVFYWRALGEPVRSVEVRMAGEAPADVAQALLAEASRTLGVGRVAAARRLAEAARVRSDGEVARTAALIADCRVDGTLDVRALRRRRRAEGSRLAAVERCAALALEAAASRLPKATSSAINDLNRLLRVRDRIESFALELARSDDPQIGGRARLAMVRTASALVRTLDRVAIASPEMVEHLPARARADAVSLWRAAHGYSQAAGLDGHLSSAIGQASDVLLAQLAPADDMGGGDGPVLLEDGSAVDVTGAQDEQASNPSAGQVPHAAEGEGR